MDVSTPLWKMSPGSRPRSQSSPGCSRERLQKTPTFEGLDDSLGPGCPEFQFWDAVSNYCGDLLWSGILRSHPSLSPTHSHQSSPKLSSSGSLQLKVSNLQTLFGTIGIGTPEVQVLWSEEEWGAFPSLPCKVGTSNSADMSSHWIGLGIVSSSYELWWIAKIVIISFRIGVSNYESLTWAVIVILSFRIGVEMQLL